MQLTAVVQIILALALLIILFVRLIPVAMPVSFALILLAGSANVAVV